MRRLLAVLLVAGCSGGGGHVFAPLPTGEATAPPAVPSLAPGSSAISVTGELALTSTVDLQCSTAPDDFFLRGQLVPDVYLAINVEQYRKPGRYPVTQVLLRRVKGQEYSSWYAGRAVMTVAPDARSAVLQATVLPPEAGTGSTAASTIRGRFACSGAPSPGARG